MMMYKADNKPKLFYPKSETDISANWKKLLQDIKEKPADDNKKKKAAHSPANPGNQKKKFKRKEKAKGKQPVNNEVVASSNKQSSEDKQENEEKKPSMSAKKRKKLDRKELKNKKFKKFNSAPSKSDDIWFEVDQALLEETYQSKVETASSGSLVKPGSFDGLTKVLAMDCEMVGTGHNGSDSILARVSIVNIMGHCVYDKYVKPTDTVTDYRTAVSGIRPSDLEKGEDFTVVQKEVNDIIKGRVLVGHAINHDLKVLYLSHPRNMIRDTSKYKPFRHAFGGRTPSLKKLAERFLAVKVQEGEHSSVQDAQAAMRLYTMNRKKWEAQVKQKTRRIRKKTKKKKQSVAVVSTKE